MLSTYKVYRYDHMDAPCVTAGRGAVLIGSHNGLFPELGTTVPGEMGGLWAGERKVCDGFFFAIDDVPLREADACQTQPVVTEFHYRMQKEEMHVIRRQFVPDGVGGCVIELEVENLRSAPRMVEVSFTVRTDIMTVAAARGEEGLDLGRDVGEYDERSQAFFARDSRNPWHAVWGADSKSRVLAADLPETIYGFGNTQGKGINGRLFYRMRVGAYGRTSMRLFVAGGYGSRSQAEDALMKLRENAENMLGEKRTRIDEMMALSAASMPDEVLSRCWNWTKIYGDWMTRTMPRGQSALCADLPDHPWLYGEGWHAALSALLPLGGAKRVQDMLRTLVKISEDTQMAPGRLARSVSLSGKVMQAGGPKDSALFVALVHRVLLWTGDRQFAGDMLAQTGLCMSYLRRSTRDFTDVRMDIREEVRAALKGQAYILRMTGADDSACQKALENMPAKEESDAAHEMTLEELARWHGELDHVERMLGCLAQMARSGLPGLPGALRGSNAEAGTLLSSRAAAGLIWPMTEGLFGLKPDAGEKTIAFAPHTPIGWDGWKLDNVIVGEAHADVSSERVSPSQAKYTIKVSEPGWKVRYTENGETKTAQIDGAWSCVLGD